MKKASAAKKPIPDPVTLRRSAAGRGLRLIYAVLMIGLALTLGWFLLRPLIFVTGPGTAMAPKTVVSSPFLTKVSEVNVVPGQIVEAGTQVASVVSPDAEAQHATFLDSLADLTRTEAQLRINLSVAESSLEQSARREAAISSTLDDINAHRDMASRRYRMEVMREFHNAKTEYERFVAQIEASKEQLDRIDTQRARLEGKIAKLESIFNEGKVTTPNGGLVSDVIAYPGQTVLPGRPIAEIYDVSKRYLEWVLPADGLRHPEPGDRVYIMHGNRAFRGEVIELLPVAINRTDVDTIFSGNVVGQYVKVRPQHVGDLPPLLSNCRVWYNNWRILDVPVEIVFKTMIALGIWREG